MDEWRAVCLHRVNGLLEGSETAIESVVRRLSPHLREPVVSTRSGTALSIPTAEIGTLILDEVHTLTTDDQRQLLDWLSAAGARPQVISTSSQRLFPRVELGLFAEALYYRLNVIRILIDSSNLRQLRRVRIRRAAESRDSAFVYSGSRTPH